VHTLLLAPSSCFRISVACLISFRIFQNYDCTRFDYFNFGRSQIRILEELVLGSQNNTPDETKAQYTPPTRRNATRQLSRVGVGGVYWHLASTINNAVSCNKEAVQFSASFVTFLFARFDENCGTAMGFIFLSSE